MIGGLGGWEWVIILIIVVLIFGVGRISKISGEIGSSIRAFREGLQGESPPATWQTAPPAAHPPAG